MDKLRIVSLLTCSMMALSLATEALAGVHLSLEGKHSEANAGYQKIVSGSGSAGISFDIGGYTRLGYTIKQEQDSTRKGIVRLG